MTEKRNIKDVPTEELLDIIRLYNDLVRQRKPVKTKYTELARMARAEYYRRQGEQK